MNKSEQFKKDLKEKGYSLRKLAKEADISNTFLCDAIAGKRNMSQEKIDKLDNILYPKVICIMNYFKIKIIYKYAIERE